jgi:serine protease
MTHMTRSRPRTTARGALAAGLLGVLLLASSSLTAGTFVSHDGPTAPGEVIVHFSTDVSPDQQAAVLRAHGGTLSHSSLVPGYVVASVPVGNEVTVGEGLAQSGVVATVEEDPIREPAAAPNDPYYPQQWNMQAIGLDAAREQSDGSGVTVAVLDTGVAYENYQDGSTAYRQAPDLARATFVLPCDMSVVPTTDPFNCQDTHANDDYGHGTHVTGTIAENTDNGYGTAGIAPQAKIMPIKVCGTNAITHKYGCPDDKLAEGIEYAVQNGAEIINLSIAGPEPVNQAVLDALDHAQRENVVVVAASGNGPNGVGTGTLYYPAKVNGVIAVGAVGFFENRAGYSNYGYHEDAQQTLDLVAPGGDPAAEGSTSVILQQTYSTCTSASDFTQFSPATSCFGTSMAAPHVSGVAALIKSKFPKLTAMQIGDDLRCSADDLGAAGPDPQYGHGLVRADRALTDIDHDGIPDCIDPIVTTPPPDDCAAPTFTPQPTLSPSPTPSAPQTPTPSGSTVTPTSTQTVTSAGLNGANVSASDTTGTATSTPTDAPTATATPTEAATAAPSPTPTGAGTLTPSGTPPVSDTPTASDLTGTPTPSPTPTATPAPPARDVLCGDVDCSGAVNAADALGILRWLTEAQPPVECIGLGYVNCDGQLDVADAVVILQYSAELLTNLRAGCPGFN